MGFGHPSREPDGGGNEKSELTRRVEAALEALSGIGPERAASFSEQLDGDHRLTFNLGQAIYLFFSHQPLETIVLPGEEDRPVKDLYFFRYYRKSPTEPETPVIKALSALRGMGESLAMSVIENSTYNQLFELQCALGALVDYREKLVAGFTTDESDVDVDDVPSRVLEFAEMIDGISRNPRVGGKLGADSVVLIPCE